MIRHCIQDAAGRPVGATIAGRDDAGQLAFQQVRSSDPDPYFVHAFARDAVGIPVRGMGRILKRDQLGDRVESEAELAGMGDEGKPGEAVIALAALPALGPAGVRDQPTGLVEADHRRRHARAPRHRVDGTAAKDGCGAGRHMRVPEEGPWTYSRWRAYG